MLLQFHHVPWFAVSKQLNIYPFEIKLYLLSLLDIRDINSHFLPIMSCRFASGVSRALMGG
jgi:hypothetical protein